MWSEESNSKLFNLLILRAAFPLLSLSIGEDNHQDSHQAAFLSSSLSIGKTIQYNNSDYFL